jgi:arylsulfatase A-like enzyme
MRELLTLLPFALMLAAACTSPGTPSPKTPTQPNIIFIMTDDHAYQAISAYGSNLIQTPEIDRLAADGIRFDRAFVTNSICAPSRAVILTGKFSHLNGVKDNAAVFDSTQLTYPKLLQEHGYQTAVVGKWHLKTQPTGFDYWKVLPDQGDYYHPEFRTEQGIVKEEGYVTDIITDLAINFLDSLRDPTKPFMLMYQHKAPHREWWPAMEDLGSYQGAEIPEPATLFDDYAGRLPAFLAEMRIADHMALTSDNKLHPDIQESHGFKSFLSWYDRIYLAQHGRLTEDERKKWDAVYGPINEDFDANTPSGNALTSWKYRRYMEDYLGTIRSVDRNVGRLMKYLEAHGLTENTLVVYTSDQGFYLGEHGWFDKRFMYEQSFRTPLIMRWPDKIPAGQVNRQLVQNIDFAPTVLDAAGVSIPEAMQGESLLPIVTNEVSHWRDALYYHYYEYPGIHAVKRHYGIRTDQYKLIHFYYDIDVWELYNLEADPDELKNVYEDEAYSGIRSQLHKRLKALRAEYGDSDCLTQQMLERDLAK